MNLEKSKSEGLTMRLPEEFRKRTKKYASDVVRFYVSLPKSRKEVEVLGYQLLRSGTSVAAHAEKRLVPDLMPSFVQRWTARSRKPTSRGYGSSFFVTIVKSNRTNLQVFWGKQMN